MNAEFAHDQEQSRAGLKRYKLKGLPYSDGLEAIAMSFEIYLDFSLKRVENLLDPTKFSRTIYNPETETIDYRVFNKKFEPNGNAILGRGNNILGIKSFIHALSRYEVLNKDTQPYKEYIEKTRRFSLGGMGEMFTDQAEIDLIVKTLEKIKIDLVNAKSNS